MHSFHQSRGRILFEVLCALGMSVSFAGAWTQTGATALLPAAAIALLYGFVRLFDMARRTPAAATVRAVEQAADQPMPVAQPVLAEPVPQVVELAEAAPPPARKTRQSKAPRKKAKAADATFVEVVKTVDIAVSAGAELPAEEPMPFDDDHHASVTPLFEPVPFARQQRTGFGRKAGLAFPR